MRFNPNTPVIIAAPAYVQEERTAPAIIADIKRIHHNQSTGMFEEGRLLAELKAAVEHGDWLQYAVDELGMEPRTVQERIAAAELAAQFPGLNLKYYHAVLLNPYTVQERAELAPQIVNQSKAKTKEILAGQKRVQTRIQDQDQDADRDRRERRQRGATLIASLANSITAAVEATVDLDDEDDRHYDEDQSLEHQTETFYKRDVQILRIVNRVCAMAARQHLLNIVEEDGAFICLATAPDYFTHIQQHIKQASDFVAEQIDAPYDRSSASLDELEARLHNVLRSQTLTSIFIAMVKQEIKEIDEQEKGDTQPTHEVIE